MSITVVLSPGYMNAGPDDWLSLIESKYINTVRVEQQDWFNPQREAWIDQLQQTIRGIEGDILLVGHSCGAIVIAQWAEQYTNNNVKGAFLVAPADVDSETVQTEIIEMRPLSTNALPFPTMLVCSNNDEHICLERGRVLAKKWGSRFVLLENAGHIHAGTGFGDWPRGEKLINELCYPDALLLR